MQMHISKLNLFESISLAVEGSFTRRLPGLPILDMFDG